MGGLMMGGTNKPFLDLMKIIEFFKAHAMGLFIFSCFSRWGVVKIFNYLLFHPGGGKPWNKLFFKGNPLLLCRC
jgi:hypothetical protein